MKKKTSVVLNYDADTGAFDFGVPEGSTDLSIDELLVLLARAQVSIAQLLAPASRIVKPGKGGGTDGLIFRPHRS